ncbi:VanZ family protein [Clostridium hydrogenum]|uniref:VanZ family protein n=1 Tax=Clostridium hydrogenum TaxID=2855764 RepID=UPI001F324821|nr:VanZ family protein [Clostridium hydrogenum]
MKKLIVAAICLLWLGFIFFNSSQNGDKSNTRSFNILNNIREEYRSIKGENKKDYSKLPASSRDEKFNLFIRKNAHAFEYCVLAVVITILLFCFGLKGKGAIVYILFICLLYAVLDEFHQLYVPGRTSQVSDVLVDFLGANLGMWFSYLIYYCVLKRKNKKI